MRRILTILVALALFLPTGRTVFGQVDVRFPGQIDIQERVRENVERARENIKVRTENVGEEVKVRLEEKRQEAEERLKEQREEFKTRLEERKTNAEQLLREKRTELQEKLQVVRDERKRQAVERLNQQINNLNERLTKHFAEVLDKLAKILDNIVSRADKAETRGLDVAPVRAAVVNAQNKIEEARAAVAAQAGKVYSFNLPDSENATATSTEAALKPAVGEARQALHRDLAALRDIIFAARDAVRQAAVTLAQIPRVDENAETSEE